MLHLFSHGNNFPEALFVPSVIILFSFCHFNYILSYFLYFLIIKIFRSKGTDLIIIKKKEQVDMGSGASPDRGHKSLVNSVRRLSKNFDRISQAVEWQS